MLDLGKRESQSVEDEEEQWRRELAAAYRSSCAISLEWLILAAPGPHLVRCLVTTFLLIGLDEIVKVLPVLVRMFQESGAFRVQGDLLARTVLQISREGGEQDPLLERSVAGIGYLWTSGQSPVVEWGTGRNHQ